MNIIINGEQKSLEEPLFIHELLDQLKVDPSLVVVERNELIVRRADWTKTRISNQDKIEIVHLVGGG
ncbi:MAG: sulfur carrier protein ThiS [Candidatus Omnitrophica bacterium]|nr:sulfur carrier protein ThiS [Candidatus Omnitrophota bacterium]MDD5671333.1 sulfur carrier protein ThiS [Candidatus Omnitrophota bacterium]